MAHITGKNARVYLLGDDGKLNEITGGTIGYSIQLPIDDGTGDLLLPEAFECKITFNVVSVQLQHVGASIPIYKDSQEDPHVVI